MYGYILSLGFPKFGCLFWVVPAFRGYNSLQSMLGPLFLDIHHMFCFVVAACICECMHAARSVAKCSRLCPQHHHLKNRRVELETR